MTAPPVHRRRFLTLSLTGACIALGPLGWLACGTARDESEAIDESQLALRLHGLLGEAKGPPDRLPANAMDRSRAIDILLGGLGPDERRALLDSPDALRSHIAALRHVDLAADRVRHVDGWLLAESEIAVAMLLAR